MKTLVNIELQEKSNEEIINAVEKSLLTINFKTLQYFVFAKVRERLPKVF